jgi:hypothetical protein
MGAVVRQKVNRKGSRVDLIPFHITVSLPVNSDSSFMARSSFWDVLGVSKLTPFNPRASILIFSYCYIAHSSPSCFFSNFF